MQHQAFRLGFAGELLQGADVVHTNIVRFIAAKFTDTGFQPVCKGISPIIADIPGKGVLHVVITLLLFAKPIMVKFAQLGAGLCDVGHPEHTAAHILFLDFADVKPSSGFQVVYSLICFPLISRSKQTMKRYDTVFPFLLFSLMVATEIHPFFCKVYQGFPAFFSRCVRFFVRFRLIPFSRFAEKVMKKP